LGTCKTLGASQTILRAGHTQASGRRQHIAGCALAAQILITAFEAAKGAQDTILETGIIVISGVTADHSLYLPKQGQANDY